VLTNDCLNAAPFEAMRLPPDSPTVEPGVAWERIWAPKYLPSITPSAASRAAMLETLACLYAAPLAMGDAARETAGYTGAVEIRDAERPPEYMVDPTILIKVEKYWST
jgi:hypothetical protein